MSGNCSTCFGWYLHPSSAAHTTVSTVSGICHTVTVDTVVCAPDDGWRYHPKHIEQFPDTNKLCNVASCWIYIGIEREGVRDSYVLVLDITSVLLNALQAEMCLE
jgi:hypothetical protein